MRATFSLVLVAVLPVFPAHASGGFWCNADDAVVKFSIESGMARGAGNPLFNFRGELQVVDDRIAPDLRKLAVTDADLMQHWLDGKMLNLKLHRDRPGDGPVGEIDLTIETKMVEEGSYEGSYELRIADMTGNTNGEGHALAHIGTASCMAE